MKQSAVDLQKLLLFYPSLGLYSYMLLLAKGYIIHESSLHLENNYYTHCRQN